MHCAASGWALEHPSPHALTLEQPDEDWLACSFPTIETLEASQRLPSLDLQSGLPLLGPYAADCSAVELHAAAPQSMPSFSSDLFGVHGLPLPQSCQPLDLPRLEVNYAANDLPALQLPPLNVPSVLPAPVAPGPAADPPSTSREAADPIDTLLHMFMTGGVPAEPVLPCSLPQQYPQQQAPQPYSQQTMSTSSSGHLVTSPEGFQMIPATPQVVISDQGL